MQRDARTIGTASPLPLTAFVLGAPFLAGLFFEPFCALASLFLIAWLLWTGKMHGPLTVAVTPALWLTLAMTALFALSPLWAVDRGMAPLGLIHFLPLPLFLIAAQQLSPAARRDLPALLPESAAVMTVLSLLLGLIPALRPYLWVNGRLAGFFQYPNTFALYAALGIVLLCRRAQWRLREYLTLTALLIAAALSGSRTVTVVLGAGVLALCLLPRLGRRRWVLAVGFVLTLAVSWLYARFTGDTSGAGRFLTISAGSSTFLGRLLYYRDAIPVILRHPLGLGYMGYWYAQGSFQTGVYTVMHIHNDLLQLLLDVGWLPGLLFLWAAVRAFTRSDGVGRTALGMMLFHCLLDFDLQFTAMGVILLLLLDEPGGRPVLRLRRPWAVPAGILAAACLYFGTATALYYLHRPAAASAVYPAYTQAWVDQLPLAETPEQMEALADRILARNDSVPLAWNARARAAYARGDFGAVIDCKRRAIALDRYTLVEYLDYADLLAVGLGMYEEAGDDASAALCREELSRVPQMLEETLAGTSPLALRIGDKPQLDLPPEYAWLRELG